MLLAMAIGSPLAVAAMLTYLTAHALIKSSLFFISGIILHRLRSISERTLFRKGKSLPITAGLWFLGGAGLAASPGFAKVLAEGGRHPYRCSSAHARQGFASRHPTYRGAANVK
jgi:multicomponent Na+:H+ antiporter subunit D